MFDGTLFFFFEIMLRLFIIHQALDQQDRDVGKSGQKSISDMRGLAGLREKASGPLEPWSEAQPAYGWV